MTRDMYLGGGFKQIAYVHPYTWPQKKQGKIPSRFQPGPFPPRPTSRRRNIPSSNGTATTFTRSRGVCWVRVETTHCGETVGDLLNQKRDGFFCFEIHLF